MRLRAGCLGGAVKRVVVPLGGAPVSVSQIPPGTLVFDVKVIIVVSESGGTQGVFMVVAFAVVAFRLPTALVSADGVVGVIQVPAQGGIARVVQRVGAADGGFDMDHGLCPQTAPVAVKDVVREPVAEWQVDSNADGKGEARFQADGSEVTEARGQADAEEG